MATEEAAAAHDAPAKRLRYYLDACIITVLIALVVMAERLDVARGVVVEARDAGRQDQAVEHASLAWIWVVTAALGVAAAILVARRLIAEQKKVDQRELAATAAEERPQLTEAQKRRRELLRGLAIATVAAWGLWQVTGIVGVAGFDLKVGPILHGASIALLGITLAWAGGRVMGDPGNAWKRASAVRVQLIVLTLLFALVFVVPLTAAQLVDVLRAWGDRPWTRPAVGIGAAMLLGAVCRASALRLLNPEDAGKAVTPQRVVASRAVLAVVLLAGVVMLALDATVGAFAAFVAVGIGFLTKWTEPQAGPTDERAQRSSRRLASNIAVLALATLFVGLVDATFDSWIFPAPLSGTDFALAGITLIAGGLFAVLVAHAQKAVDDTDVRPPVPAPQRTWLIGLVALVLTLVAALLPPRAAGVADVLWALPFLIGATWIGLNSLEGHGKAELWAGTGVVLGTLVAVYLEPIRTPRVFGTFGVALIGVTALLLLLHALASAASRRTPRERFGFVPAKLPVVTLLGVWVVAAFLSQQSTPTAHQARTIEGQRPAATLHDSVRAWLDREAGSSPPPYMPMLMVAASGGGAKASYWTDLVLDCVLGQGAPDGRDDSGEPTVPRDECAGSPNGPARFDKIFLTSSVSGGSVGIYHLLEHQGGATTGHDWVMDAAGKEVLSPTVAWGMFHDLPAFMIGKTTDPRDCTAEMACRLHADRALVQEAAIAGQEGIVPRAAMTTPFPWAPVAIFNGALDGGEGRVLASRLSLAPPRVPDPSCDTPPSRGEPAAGSIDARDVLKPDQDVPLVTAALLSARFPIIAPAARVGDTKPPDGVKGCSAKPPLPPVEVRDGGYVENTGLLTIADLLPSIRAEIDAWSREKKKETGHPVRVQVIVLSIDDDPAVIAPKPKLEERKRETLGISKRAGPSYFSRLTRNRLTSCQYPRVTYKRVSPPPHIGAHAATGWELSRQTKQHDLRDALSARRPSPQPRPDRSDPGEIVKWLRDVLDGARAPTRCGG